MADQASSWTSILPSLAAILNAVAWPAVALYILLDHRVQISRLLQVLEKKLNSAKKVKLAQIEISDFENEADKAIVEAREGVDDSKTPQEILQGQIKAAVNFDSKIDPEPASESRALETVRRRIFALAGEYEKVRKEMPSGPLRTRKMNEISAAMRTLALAGLPLRTSLVKSNSVGKRLAAICMLQVEPRPRYFRWLVERIKAEDQAFILFQASLAILETVKRGFYINPTETRYSIEDAIRVVSSFPGGQPDRNTIDVLNEALSSVR